MGYMALVGLSEAAIPLFHGVGKLPMGGLILSGETR